MSSTLRGSINNRATTYRMESPSIVAPTVTFPLDGLLHHWKLDEIGSTGWDYVNYDPSVSTYALSGDTTDTGKLDSGRKETSVLSASSDYIGSFVGITHGAANSSFTYGFWAKIVLGGSPASSNIMHGHGASSNTQIFRLTYNAASGKLDWLVGASGNVATSNITIVSGQWHYIVVGYDGSTSKSFISVDNETVIEQDSNGHVGGTNDSHETKLALAFGLLSGSGITSITVDSISKWTRVLTFNEMSALWNSGAGLDYTYTIEDTSGLSVVSTIDPANHNNSTQTGDAVDMDRINIKRAVFILIAGSNDATIDFKLQESTSSGGTYTDIPGKAITQETGGNDDNKQWVIFITPAEITKRYVKPHITIGNGTTNIVGLVALLELKNDAPDGQGDLSSVSQIIA